MCNCCGCGSDSARKANVQWFKFPLDSEIRTQWLKNCGYTEREDIDSEILWLCSEHFDSTCFEAVSFCLDFKQTQLSGNSLQTFAFLPR